MHVVSATSAVTTLEGQVPDQAALKGVLDTVYDLHLLLLEVTCLQSIRHLPSENAAGSKGMYHLE
jgi:hypothetical protein